MKHKKGTKPKQRPVIVVDKNAYDELAVVPASTRDTKNTTEYNKYGVNYYRHDIEVEDNENKPIVVGDKFKQTKRCTKLPESEALRIRDHVVNHTKFSSDNRSKYNSFLQRHKKK